MRAVDGASYVLIDALGGVGRAACTDRGEREAADLFLLRRSGPVFVPLDEYAQSVIGLQLRQLIDELVQALPGCHDLRSLASLRLGQGRCGLR
jgi:hypothetical protein